MELSLQGIKKRSEWETKGFRMPDYDISAMREYTYENPAWVHFGAGNIFRAVAAAAQQRLLNAGKAKAGIIVRAPSDKEIIERVYVPHDNLFVVSTLHKDSIDNEVVASVSESLAPADMNRLIEVFTAPSLQIVSFTITEKAYTVTDAEGKVLPHILADMNAAPELAPGFTGMIVRLCFERYKAGRLPLALFSMDNCSKNGEKLKNLLCTVANAWRDHGFVPEQFIEYLNGSQVAFPCTMIDRITPVPSKKVAEQLSALGCEDMEILRTAKDKKIAPFVNAEETENLVIEDAFPNGRPPLEDAGIIFTDRETVDKVEKMKVRACLNPLHSALAVFGCLLGYKYIYEAMNDHAIVGLISRIGYREALPHVPNPGIINPEEFLRQTIEVRLSNPYIPDTLSRISMDTSQKIPARYGEVLKTMTTDETDELVGYPFFFAGWLRYLLCIDDFGKAFAPIPDPMFDELHAILADIRLGDSGNFTETLRPILSNRAIFGIDLFENGLAAKTERFFAAMISGPGAVRKALDELFV